MAYLSLIEYADVVITEDSDLLPFGARVIFYKMTRNLTGIEYKL